MITEGKCSWFHGCMIHSYTHLPYKLYCYLEMKVTLGKGTILIYGFEENLPVSMQAHVQETKEPFSKE